jgi:hypothetical protein
VNNKAIHFGGGLRLESGTVDVRTGVLISGSDRSDANLGSVQWDKNLSKWKVVGTYYGGHAYCRYGPKKYDATINFAFIDSK